jgi:hypothetical protein
VLAKDVIKNIVHKEMIEQTKAILRNRNYIKELKK